MESEKELNEKIVIITMKIQNEFPELSKYLNELTVTIPIENSPAINERVLKEYHDSLVKLLTTYKLEMVEKANAKP